jgi:hypothetical protein
MKQFLFIAFCVSLTVWGCKTTQNSKMFVITEGISGIVLEEKGNQMPMKGAPANEPQGFKTVVYVYPPTTLSQVTRLGQSAEYTAIHTPLVDSAATDSAGRFGIALPPGTYSIFVKYKDHFYANLFDAQNRINLYTVEAGKPTQARVLINAQAVY